MSNIAEIVANGPLEVTIRLKSPDANFLGSTACSNNTSIVSKVRVECFDPHTAFEIRGLKIDPFPVPHDAREPAQMVFDDGADRLGVLTDVGIATPHILQMLAGCSACRCAGIG